MSYTMNALRNLTLLSALAAVGGCYYEDTTHSDYYPAGPDPVPEDQIYQVEILAGETLVAEGGQGAGVFLEYQGSGNWHVFTACDSEISGVECGWDVFASVGGSEPITNIDGDDLEADDTLYTAGPGTLGLAAYTAYGLDGMSFQTEVGQTVRFDVFFDGVRDPRFIYWVDAQALHAGAPSDPLDVMPIE